MVASSETTGSPGIARMPGRDGLAAGCTRRFGRTRFRGIPGSRPDECGASQSSQPGCCWRAPLPSSGSRSQPKGPGLRRLSGFLRNGRRLGHCLRCEQDQEQADGDARGSRPIAHDIHLYGLPGRDKSVGPQPSQSVMQDYMLKAKELALKAAARSRRRKQALGRDPGRAPLTVVDPLLASSGCHPSPSVFAP